MRKLYRHRGFGHLSLIARRSRAIKACLLLSLLSGNAWASELSAQDWLNRLSSAFSKQSYQGVFVYYSGNNVETLKIIHSNRDGIERERIVHLDGEFREVIREGKEVTCITPDAESASLDHTIPSGPFAKAFARDFSRLGDFYQVKEYGLSRVAGRQAVHLGIEAKDRYRFGYALWIDTESGLLLKSKLHDQQGQMLEFFQFTQLTLGEVDPALLSHSQGGVLARHYNQAELSKAELLTEADRSQWQIGWLPGGFKMADYDVRRAASGTGDTLVYSDGLSAFSVFVDPAEQQPMEGISRMGATVAVTKVLDWQGKKYQVTVIGEVPEETAMRVADSLHGNS